MMKSVPATLKTAVVLRHVDFEDLGVFEAVLTSAGYRIHYYDIGIHALCTLDPCHSALLIVLGGPVGLADAAAYPFLEEEQGILKARLASNRPTLGICLGAQQIAYCLGATVAAGPCKEIGFSPLRLTDEGRRSALRHLEDVPVLHWHGDRFEVPDSGVNLASTAACPVQAFAVGPNILGLQFHPEVNACAGIERWLIGHACELAEEAIDPKRLRLEAQAAGSRLRDAAGLMLNDWLEGLVK